MSKIKITVIHKKKYIYKKNHGIDETLETHGEIKKQKHAHSEK